MKKIIGLVLAVSVTGVAFAGKGSGIGGGSKYTVVVNLNAAGSGSLTLFENVKDKATGKIVPTPVNGARDCWAHGNPTTDTSASEQKNKRVRTPSGGSVYATTSHAFLAGHYETGGQWANATFFAKYWGEPIGIHGGPNGDSHGCIRTDVGCAAEIKRRADEASSPASSVGKLTSEGSPRRVSGGHMRVQVNMP